MREALLKKRCGIPAALLILLVLAGVATAALVATFTYTITTKEPLSFTQKESPSTIYQGESDDIIVTATNASSAQSYGIFVDASVVDGQVDSIAYSSVPTGKLVSTEQDIIEGGNDVNGDGDKLDAWYNIAASGSYDITVTVDSADDAPTGTLQVTLNFQRETTY